MNLATLNERQDMVEESRQNNSFVSFEKLLDELGKRELPGSVVQKLNIDIENLNSFTGNNKDYKKALKKSLRQNLQQLEKELKLVPKNHYRNMWLALGMAVFGVPIGVALGTSLQNMSFIGIGIPIGMAVGIAIGTDMDKKAKAKGNQLDMVVKY